MGKFFLLLLFREPKAITHQWPWWTHLLLIGLFAVYVWLRTAYGKRISQILNAFFTSRAVNQLIREESASYTRLSILLTLFSQIVISLFLFEIILLRNLPLLTFFENYFSLYLIILTIIVVLYQLKALLIKFSGFVFKKDTGAEEYVFNISLFNQSLGLFLFPIVIGIAFIQLIPFEFLIYAGVILIGVIFLYRLYRSLAGGTNNNILISYLFLYLCALEILPLVVLIKVFVDKI